MSVSGVGTTASFMTQSLIDLRRQLDDLQRQISTGEKVVSYSGISPPFRTATTSSARGSRSPKRR